MINEWYSSKKGTNKIHSHGLGIFIRGEIIYPFHRSRLDNTRLFRLFTILSSTAVPDAGRPGAGLVPRCLATRVGPKRDEGCASSPSFSRSKRSKLDVSRFLFFSRACVEHPVTIFLDSMQRTISRVGNLSARVKGCHE